MNLFLMPMWFLSGALFPPRQDMFAPLLWVMRLNPLTYGLAGIRRALYLGVYNPSEVSLPPWWLCVGVSVAFAAAMLWAATAVAGRRVAADYQ
jgi:ABC-2 type transport system permease protein